VRIASKALTSISITETLRALLGLWWKTVGKVLLSGALLSVAVSSDAGTPSDQGLTAQAKTTGSARSGQGNSSHSYTNRLIHEKSPYLLLHAHNPVDWYPWGKEAFAKAKRENKPIFLSVGYYTCHWCHVMERESYSDPTIAGLINRWFVAIKVDREERPDIDNEYMNFVEATTGSRGLAHERIFDS
jgi:thioredoxin-related protein